MQVSIDNMKPILIGTLLNKILIKKRVVIDSAKDWGKVKAFEFVVDVIKWDLSNKVVKEDCSELIGHFQEISGFAYIENLLYLLDAINC